MKVMKFGGSCLQSPEGLLRMIERIRHEPRPLVIVLSALKGVTDELLGMLARAAEGEQAPIDALRARHHEVLEAVSEAARAPAAAAVDGLLGELERVLSGVAALREVPPTTRDRVLAMGERLSIHLGAAHLAHAGLPARALVAEEAGILTTAEPGDARILARSRALVLERFDPAADVIYVVAGFVGCDRGGRITTIGRGGSDTTATYLASVLGGPAVLWKDTPGLLTADPRVVARPRVIERLHYLDALELAHYGLPAIAAKAIHPARRAGVPIEIHAFQDEGNPSVIGEVETSRLALTCVPKVVAIDLLGDAGPSGASDLDDADGEPAEPRPGQFLVGVARFLEGLAAAGIAPLLLSEASPAGETTIVVRAEHRARLEPLLGRADAGGAQVRDGLAVVSLIGSTMRGRIGFAAAVFDALARASINIDAIAQTASERNISVIVAAEQAQAAVRALHERFVEGDE